MNWNFQRSKERLASERARLEQAGLNIQRLTREMDLANLSPTDARIVHGAHIYCHIANFSEVLNSPLMRRDDFKRLHRLLHILRIEQRYTLQQVFDGDKIQVQGPKFHGLLYKPYDDDPALAWKSVLAAIALKLTISDALPIVFPEYPKLLPSLGLSIGDCLVANIGARGERELISVGGAANHAAKIMHDVRPITITRDLYSNLDDERKELFTASATVYTLDLPSISDANLLLKDEGYAWNAERSSERMARTRDDLPLDDINSSEAKVRIDFDLLGPKNMKTCSAASVFVDIDGYTATIDGLFEDEEDLGKASQWLHLFRYEMRHVTVDRDAVAVQHQGDRLQALTHMPSDDEASAMRRAIELCIDCNSSMEDVLNEFHADLGKLHVAIGADFGKTVAIRSGVRGDLDAGCLGHAVGRAEHLQFRSAGGQITISKSLYEILDDEVIRQEFALSADGNSYAAKGLTWTKIEDLRKKRSYESKASVGFDARSSGIVFGISGGKSPDVIPLKQTRPWGDGVSSGPNPFVWPASRGTVWGPARVQRELDYLRTQPFFRLANQSVQQGRLQVEGELAYTLLETGRIQSLAIRMEYPTEYPWDVPRIFDRENHFQPSAKGHQFPDHRLCLSFPPRSEFTLGSEALSSEVLGASLIWLDKRFIFERTTDWPGEAEEHGWSKPLRQLLVEEANRSTALSLKAWTNWIVEELVAPNYDGGCPCCSGRPLRLCHRKLAMLVFFYRFSNQQERELYGRGTALEAA